MEAHGLQNRSCRFLFVLILTALPLSGAHAQCDTWLAKPAAIEGQAQVMRHGTEDWSVLSRGDVLCQGDRIRVLENSRIALELPNDTVTRLDEHTVVEFISSETAGRSWLEMLRGFAHFISRVPRSLTVETPYMNAAVEGTEFLVGVAEDESSLVVFEGVVVASNAFGQVSAETGQTVVASKGGGAPVLRAMVDPWDAVQWAIYYPPLLSLDAIEPERLPPDERQALERAKEAVQSGNVSEALQLLTELAPQSLLKTYRASLLLSVGRAVEATQDIEDVLSRTPADGYALALKSIIATTQSDRESALAAAKAAVDAAPSLAAPHLALSYAWQSRFELERARAVLEAAVADIEDDALLWARLAEVRLMFREFKGALEAAQTGEALGPNNAHVKTVLGFAHLLKVDVDVALKHFELAITLDQGAPLPRLGRGLALIRDGELSEGRRELEIAVALDPSNALIRSYLGKAYYEEKRSLLAADQYELAKSLDPNDPTAWFYDAIRKQTENRPIEALGDLERAIEKNGQRAVYRSKLLLDDDTASRNARLARVYQDLGFEELALLEGWKSLSVNPANHSAHRMVADAHRGQFRNEFSRLSEILQSQMLAPVGQSQISPSLIQNEFPISLSYGSTALGLNEFSDLYVRDGVNLQTKALLGADATYGEEVIISGLEGNLAFSIGQFHLETDGFRPNSEFNSDLFNAFVQYDFSPAVSVQFEARRKLRENGDVRELVDNGNFSLELGEDRTENAARVGLSLSPAPNNRLLFMAAWMEDDFMLDDFLPFLGETLFTDQHVAIDSEGFNYEFQNIQVYEKVRWVWGAAYDKGDTTEGARISITDGVFSLPLLDVVDEKSSEHVAAYVYSTIDVNDLHRVTIGSALNSHRQFSNDLSQISPKFGWMWSPTNATTYRAAVFRGMKRSLFLNQTLEPTQVAGFTQIFDETSGTDASVYAAAIDHRAGNNSSLGVEAVRRRLEWPVLFFNSVGGEQGSGEAKEEDREQRWYKVYYNHIASNRWVFGLSYDWSRDGRQFVAGDVYSETDPVQLKTEILDASLTYSHPLGLLSRLNMRYVSQTSRFKLQFEEVRVNEKFPVVDYEIGFRFPNRRGSINFVVRNLFDNSFSTQQGPFVLTQPLIRRYYPEQAFFARFDFLFQ